MFRYAFNTIGLVMYRSFNSGAYREILKVYAWEVNFHPENCLIYVLGNAISCVFCRIFKENHEYDENAVVGCLFQPSLVSSTKLTPLIKKVTSKCMVRRLKPFRRPNSVSTLSIYIVRKIHQSSQFNNVFTKMLSGNIYIHF